MTANVRTVFSRWSPAQKVMAGLALTLAGSFGAQADIPGPDTEQGKMLAPYTKFIGYMQKPGNKGSCCNLNDGRGKLEQRTKPDGTLQVKMTHNLAGVALPEKDVKWIDIPEDAILSNAHARATCATYKENNPTDPEKDTCKPPPFNVIWWSDSGYVHCYYPKPSGS